MGSAHTYFKLGLALIVVVGISGCPDGASVSMPSWDPEPMADAALQQLDKNGDSQLSAEELEASPGLAYSLEQPGVDKNEDKQFSRDELVARFQDYAQSGVAYLPYAVQVTYNGRALPGAQVRFVPEEYLGGVVPEMTATTGPDGRASVESDKPGLARVGIYRVEIISDKVKLPAKYNTESTLGIEISPFTDPKLAGGLAPFHLRSK